VSVVLLLAGAAPSSVAVGSSPLAELTAALHAFTEAEHHAGTVRWARNLDSDASLNAELRRRIRAWAPLWASYRARYLLPLRAEGGRELADELGDIADLPLDRFVELTGFAVRGGNSGTPLDDLLRDGRQRAGLLAAAEQRSSVRTELAHRLLDAPEALRTDLLAMLTEAALALEPDLTRVARTIGGHLAPLRTAVQRGGMGEALAALDPAASYRTDPPRVVYDKFHHGIVNLATTRCLVVPSVFNRPHLLVKHEPGQPAVIQYPLVPDGGEQPGYTAVHRRLEVLRDPGRQRIARLIAREPLTPTELARRSGMTVPQVSRHLARLRDAGLVTIDREGRRAHYQLDLEPVRRIGEDLLTALFR
jgi:DNA-binding transcriptional ArsR family regulator